MTMKRLLLTLWLRLTWQTFFKCPKGALPTAIFQDALNTGVEGVHNFEEGFITILLKDDRVLKFSTEKFYKDWASEGELGSPTTNNKWSYYRPHIIEMWMMSKEINKITNKKHELDRSPF